SSEMAIKAPHSDWKLDQITPIEVRAVGLDQLLTHLWLRVLHGPRPLVRMSTVYNTVAQVADLMERRHDGDFDGFGGQPGAAEAWLRSDLLRVLKKHPEQYAVARPVHGLATRLRGTGKAASDSFASRVVYDWVEFTDERLLVELREFIDVDPDDPELDLASYARALLGRGEEPDIPRPAEPGTAMTPHCLGVASSYCRDLRRLLAYRTVMPRTVLVDHIQRLTGFHLGLYLLRLFRI